MPAPLRAAHGLSRGGPGCTGPAARRAPGWVVGGSSLLSVQHPASEGFQPGLLPLRPCLLGSQEGLAGLSRDTATPGSPTETFTLAESITLCSSTLRKLLLGICPILQGFINGGPSCTASNPGEPFMLHPGSCPPDF